MTRQVNSQIKCFSAELNCICNLSRVAMKHVPVFGINYWVLLMPLWVLCFFLFFLQVYVTFSRLCSWLGVLITVNPFPRAGLDIQKTIQTLPGTHPIKWTSSKAWSPIGSKRGRIGLSGEIDSWQLHCPKWPQMTGLLCAGKERGEKEWRLETNRKKDGKNKTLLERKRHGSFKYKS